MINDVYSEFIEFKNDCTFLAFGDELWSGAKEKWNEADEETRIAVWNRVRDWVDAVSCDGELPHMTQINDLIWFECDDLFYPPTFIVKVYIVDADNEIMSKEPLMEKMFSGLGAEDEARKWWEDKSSEGVSGVKAILWNDEIKEEEEL